MRAEPAHRGFRVGDAIDGFGFLPRGDAVIGSDGDDAARREGAALGFKLGRRTRVPAAAKKEHDGRAIFLRGAEGFKNIERERGVADGFIDLGAGTCHHGRVRGLGGG